MADAEIGHRTCSLGQIAHIAIRLGRKFDWDPNLETFGDPNADRMLSRTYRPPWDLDTRA
jgi:hypothetical protein